MGRSQETYNKKEREKKRQQKKEAKEKRKAERKANPVDKGDNITYVDKFGNFSDTPPPPAEMVNAEEITLGIPKSEDIADEVDVVRKGTVSFFNDSKGYGFIKDHTSQESIFVHSSNTTEPIAEQDKVTFEIEKGPKGLVATNVKLA